MEKNLLLTLIAMILSTAAWSCSDDEDKVNVMFAELEYRHVDLKELPQPVMDVIDFSGLNYIIRGQYKGREAYMYNHLYSSSSYGQAIYFDGTNFSDEEIVDAVESGVFNKWICIYHSSRDLW
ncbi:MAG: hypothetical protein NC127_03190 [Muribaculum sp.]|nr:hypothetical protein [Muribaculum sp.]